MNINALEYRDKVRGCWLGKNIGGTLGGPMEGKKETNEVEFYTHDLNGGPLPNDDLDLQMIWLVAAEFHGVCHLTPQILGEYWLNNIIGPWNEYSVCRFNIAKGLYPPLSGSTNNDVWKNSNGAWIRSEIWACLFPGCPDEAIRFAYMDACADHCGDGVYAEMFTAALESAAFVVDDVRELIRIGLAKIPDDCRVARSVNLVCECFDRGDDWLTARNKAVEDSSDLGWFQAPANVAFVVIGLLYGGCDFGGTVCRAVNCGDDTDCTAATAGAILGIMHGASGIPEKWIAPIGDGIKNIAINLFGRPQAACLPKTITALTDRVIRLADLSRYENPALFSLENEKTEIPDGYRAALTDREAAREIWSYSPWQLTFPAPYGEITVDYENGAEIAAGETKKITVGLCRYMGVEDEVYFKWHMPDGWHADPPCGSSMVKSCWNSTFTHTVRAGEFVDNIMYVTLEVRLSGRMNPTLFQVPFLQTGNASYPKGNMCRRISRDIRRVTAGIRRD